MTDATIRCAQSNDFLAIMRVLDGANLESDAAVVENRIGDGLVLVATDAGRVIGTLVAVPLSELDEFTESESPVDTAGGAADSTAGEAADSAAGAHVEAVAVRLRRRGQGIGTALMRDAADRWRPLTADFYPGLSGFYEKLEFDIEKREEQFRGVLE